MEPYGRRASHLQDLAPPPGKGGAHHAIRDEGDMGGESNDKARAQKGSCRTRSGEAEHQGWHKWEKKTRSKSIVQQQSRSWAHVANSISESWSPSSLSRSAPTPRLAS
jgi:hypothetical protein